MSDQRAGFYVTNKCRAWLAEWEASHGRYVEKETEKKQHVEGLGITQHSDGSPIETPNYVDDENEMTE